MSNTILYLTDNTLDPEIASACRVVLKREARDIPIVSVSQKPIDLGKNICVGEIGRNWISLYKQILAGLEAIETEFVVIAEHDCMYSHEHLSWTPPKDDRFYYNHNHWLVQWGGNHPEMNGMYSYWPAPFTSGSSRHRINPLIKTWGKIDSGAISITVSANLSSISHRSGKEQKT